jgi:thiamine biosynthesis lipoprotein
LVFDTMGTTVSVATPARLAAHVQAEVRDTFDAYDARFSLYRPDSEASAVASGALDPGDASAELRAAQELAWQWSGATGGSFTPRRPDGVLDLAGVVKAMAIEAAAAALRRSGVLDWCLNAGGDVLVNGSNTDGRPWDRQTLLTQFTCSVTQPALATSGTAERGEHVWRQVDDPAGPNPEGLSAEFRQVSVAGPDIVTADVLATAVLAGGRRCLDRVLATWPVQVIAAGVDGGYLATAAFRHVPPSLGGAGATRGSRLGEAPWASPPGGRTPPLVTTSRKGTDG